MEIRFYPIASNQKLFEETYSKNAPIMAENNQKLSKFLPRGVFETFETYHGLHFCRGAPKVAE